MVVVVLSNNFVMTVVMFILMCFDTRRKFVESLEENRSLSMWFIDEIGRLLGIEHDCKKAGFNSRPGSCGKALKEQAYHGPNQREV